MIKGSYSYCCNEASLVTAVFLELDMVASENDGEKILITALINKMEAAGVSMSQGRSTDRVERAVWDQRGTPRRPSRSVCVRTVAGTGHSKVSPSSPLE